MKTIIAGSRDITNYHIVEKAWYNSGFIMTEVVSGCARGVDKLGEKLGDSLGLPVKRFPADWKTYPKAAGFIRNKQMGDYADALIAIWDGASRGTLSCIELAEVKGLKVYIYRV